MGLKFRKKLKILPGVSLNIGKRGLNSISLGKRGTSINIPKNGKVKSTVGIPGSGFSYTSSSGCLIWIVILIILLYLFV